MSHCDPVRVRLSELEALAAQWEAQGDEANTEQRVAMKEMRRFKDERLGANASMLWACAENLRKLIANNFEVGMWVTYFADGQKCTGRLRRVPVPDFPTWLIERDGGGADSVPATSIRYLGEGGTGRD